MRYLQRIGTISSQAANTLLLDGNPDQTISARAYLNRDKKYWGMVYRTVNKIFFWEKDHCKSSHELDIEYAQQTLNR